MQRQGLGALLGPNYCELPLLTLYLYILIHARRQQDSRRTIDLLGTNPRITEWPRPGDC